MSTFRTFCLFAAATSVTSCSDVMNVYAPSPVNSPMLREKNEVKMKLAYNNLQAAYAITDNIAFIANGHLVARGKSDPENTDGDHPFDIDKDLKGGTVEMGMGYFKAFDKDDKKICPVFEVFGGYGRGGFRTISPAYYEVEGPKDKADFMVRNKVERLFVQPAIGISGKYIEGSLTSRFSMLRFREMNISPRVFDGNELMMSSFPGNGKRWQGYYEPAVTFGGGYKWIKGFLQVGYSFTIGEKPQYAYYYGDYMQRVFGSVGVAFTLGKWLKH